jgi:Protein of unknown function (DUF4245)
VSGQAGRYQRSAAGMVGAMLVLLAVVIAFVILRDLNRNDPANPVRAIDFASDVEFAREQAGFELLAPERLPEGWRATTARYVPGATERWHLGMLTEGGRYVGLEQSTASTESMVEDHVDESATRGRSVSVAGAEWTTWRDDGGDLALVREDAGTTTLVVGHEVDSGVLAEFAASLR